MTAQRVTSQYGLVTAIVTVTRVMSASSQKRQQGRLCIQKWISAQRPAPGGHRKPGGTARLAAQEWRVPPGHPRRTDPPGPLVLVPVRLVRLGGGRTGPCI